MMCEAFTACCSWQDPALVAVPYGLSWLNVSRPVRAARAVSH
jgi:hypothetical protein